MTDCFKGHCLHDGGWLEYTDRTITVLRQCCWCGFRISIQATPTMVHGDKATAPSILQFLPENPAPHHGRSDADD